MLRSGSMLLLNAITRWSRFISSRRYSLDEWLPISCQVQHYEDILPYLIKYLINSRVFV